ncbi:hypothetical protein ABZ470_39890 [Streptosporangium sp. NPDC020072]|uniref:hypothetical protein n=1 Tax=Streptosporangium sp. NPDC020072 TaxID=3154788 RepID=UPI00342486F3
MSKNDKKATAVLIVGSIALIAALVLAANAADDEDEVTAVCIDPTTLTTEGYEIVDERFCDGGSHSAYVYYYGGSTSGIRVRGGTTIRPADVRIVTPRGTVIQRGGFGSRGRSGS